MRLTIAIVGLALVMLAAPTAASAQPARERVHWQTHLKQHRAKLQFCRAEGPDGDKLRVRANNLSGRHHHFFKVWVRRMSDYAVIHKWNVHVPKHTQRFKVFLLPTTRRLSYAIRDRYQPGTEVGSTTEFGPTLCRW